MGGREFNLPQTLLWVANARYFGSVSNIDQSISSLASGKASGRPSTLFEAFHIFQSSVHLLPALPWRSDFGVAQSIGSFGDEQSVGHKAFEVWGHIQDEILGRMRDGALRVYGRASAASARELISPEAASSARFVDHDAPCLVDINFPLVYNIRYYELTFEADELSDVFGVSTEALPDKEMFQKTAIDTTSAKTQPRIAQDAVTDFVHSVADGVKTRPEVVALTTEKFGCRVQRTIFNRAWKGACKRRPGETNKTLLSRRRA